MGRRSRQSFIKRAKEKRRQEKAALKRERRLARKRGEDEEARTTETAALVLVGLQNDFFPGGALGVPGGEDVVPVANRLIEEFSRAELPIVATRDWHPPSHCSFSDQGGPWPQHCVADTTGAAFHPDLRLPEDATIVTMNAGPDGDVFSAFRETGLGTKLRRLGAERIVLCGLATDYFVRDTALDGRSEGFGVTVVQDGIRGVDQHPGDSVEALREMESAGVGVASAGAVLAPLESSLGGAVR